LGFKFVCVKTKIRFEFVGVLFWQPWAIQCGCRCWQHTFCMLSVTCDATGGHT